MRTWERPEDTIGRDEKKLSGKKEYAHSSGRQKSSITNLSLSCFVKRIIDC